MRAERGSPRRLVSTALTSLFAARDRSPRWHGGPHSGRRTHNCRQSGPACGRGARPGRMPRGPDRASGDELVDATVDARIPNAPETWVARSTICCRTASS